MPKRAPEGEHHEQEQRQSRTDTFYPGNVTLPWNDEHSNPLADIKGFVRRIDSRNPEYCAACNYNRHFCPGCGGSVPHGTITCAICEAYAAHLRGESTITDCCPE